MSNPLSAVTYRQEKRLCACGNPLPPRKPSASGQGGRASIYCRDCYRKRKEEAAVESYRRLHPPEHLPESFVYPAHLFNLGMDYVAKRLAGQIKLIDQGDFEW